MMIFTTQTFLVLGTLLAPALAQQVNCTLKPDYPAPVTQNGWTSQLVYKELDNPRGILFDSAGNLLVIDRSEGIVRLAFDDGEGTCLSVSSKTLVVNSDDVRYFHSTIE
jgi:glucose/arabinose dehydrogenase